MNFFVSRKRFVSAGTNVTRGIFNKSHLERWFIDQPFNRGAVRRKEKSKRDVSLTNNNNATLFQATGKLFRCRNNDGGSGCNFNGVPRSGSALGFVLYSLAYPPPLHPSTPPGRSCRSKSMRQADPRPKLLPQQRGENGTNKKIITRCTVARENIPTCVSCVAYKEHFEILLTLQRDTTVTTMLIMFETNYKIFE